MQRLICGRVCLALVLGGAVLGSRGSASGQTTATWMSDVSGNWIDPTMWSTNPNYPNNGLPNPGDAYNAVIDALGNNYTVSLDSDITINWLTLTSAGWRRCGRQPACGPTATSTTTG